jgi:hypothetical protein
VTQFYSGAGRTAAGGRVIGGAQDNYSLQLSGGLWRRWQSGDGGSVAVDPVSDQVFYGEYVYAAVHRSLNGGTTSSYICGGITEAITDTDDSPACGTGTTQKSNFIAPILLDPNTRDRLYVGAASLWVSDNPRAPSVTWRTVRNPSSTTGNYINAIAVAEGDANTVWVGYNNGEVWRSSDATSFAPTWTRVGQGVLPARLVNRITIDRDDRNHVIVAVTGFTPNDVWETRNGGGTWASITGNLPQAPVFDVKRHPRKPNWLYAATSVGVYTSEDGGASWSTSNEGPANIRVRELFWIDDTTLGAATYGRGMFKVTVAAGGPDSYQGPLVVGCAGKRLGHQHRSAPRRPFLGALHLRRAGQAAVGRDAGRHWNATFTRFTGPSSSRRVVLRALRREPPFDRPAGGHGDARLRRATRRTLSYTINGISGTKSISRIAFGPRTPRRWQLRRPVVGRHGAERLGRRDQPAVPHALLALVHVRPRRAAHVVRDAGRHWTARQHLFGDALPRQRPRWLGVPYDASRHSLRTVGNVTFTFTDAQNAAMSYTIDGVSGTNALTRLPF